MKKIKIAVVSSSFPPLSSGGISSAMYGLLKLLKKNQVYEVKGFTFNDNIKNIKKLNLIEDYIERSGSPYFIIRFINILLNLFFKLIDRKKISYQVKDIAISFIGSLKIAFKLKLFSPDIIFISDHGAPMLYISLFIKSNYVWITHHNPIRFINNPLIGMYSEKDAKLALKLEKKALKNATLIISPSIYMKKIFYNSYNINKEVFTIPNIIDIELINKIRTSNDKKLKKNKIVKIFIPGVGSKIKGEKYILSIMSVISSFLPEREIIFYLSGRISKSLQYEIYKSTNIKFKILGYLKYEKNLLKLNECDICISPTLLENFGMSILESVLLGIPVVTFDVGGNREIIINGKNGYLVDYLNVGELCKKAIELIEKPINRDYVIEETNKIYCVEKIKENYDFIIKKILKNKEI